MDPVIKRINRSITSDQEIKNYVYQFNLFCCVQLYTFILTITLIEQFEFIIKYILAFEYYNNIMLYNKIQC